MLIFIWELTGVLNTVDQLYFPMPHNILLNTLNLISYENLLAQIGFSMLRLFTSFAIAFPLALGLALASSHFKSFDDFFNPLIAFTFPIPKVAVYPLMLLILGVDYLSQICLISVGIFYIMYVNFRIGFKRILSSQYKEIALIYKITGKRYVWDFLIMGAIQEIYAGLKLAFNYGLTLVVVSELTFSRNGIGHFIWRSWDQFKILNVYSGVLVISIIGLIFYYFFNSLINSTNARN